VREGERLRLGHIVYSNCLPVHAGMVEDTPPWVDLIDGVPGELNRMLSRGELHVAPSSSVEFARNASRYRIIPDLVIGCRGPVRSILLLSRRDPADLDGLPVAVPTSSATSVALLRVLLARRGVRPELRWFDQAAEDPFATGAEAALFIGDVALDPHLHPDLPVRLDLGAAWWEATGLPFAFAVWQVAGGDAGAVACLHRTLVRSRDASLADLDGLAGRHADRFRMPAVELAGYWRMLRYTLDGPMQEGLRTFYRYAAEAGVLPGAPPLRWTGPAEEG
jgi:chorismate dehydratase